MKNSAVFKALYVLLILAILVPPICMAWPGKVVSVTDGDTIKVIHDGKEEKIRLYGIDAPEKSQSFGQKAQDFAASLVAGKTVEVERKDTDRYGRTVGLVSVGGQNVNELMVKNGYAWVYHQYCKESFCSDWTNNEAIAKTEKRGMWVDPQIVPPWEFRHPGGQQVTATRKSDSGYGQSKDIATAAFHGNVNSHTFHRPSCQHYYCPNCVAVFKSRADAINSRYVPCKLCNP